MRFLKNLLVRFVLRPVAEALVTIGAFCAALCLAAALVGGTIWGVREVSARLGHHLDPAHNMAHLGIYAAAVFVAFSISVGISDPLWLWMRERASGARRPSSFEVIRPQNRPLDR